jgi:hypothetical protein
VNCCTGIAKSVAMIVAGVVSKRKVFVRAYRGWAASTGRWYLFGFARTKFGRGRIGSWCIERLKCNRGNSVRRQRQSHDLNRIGLSWSRFGGVCGGGTASHVDL